MKKSKKMMSPAKQEDEMPFQRFRRLASEVVSTPKEKTNKLSRQKRLEQTDTNQ